MRQGDIQYEMLKHLKDHPWSYTFEIHKALQALWKIRGKRGFLNRAFSPFSLDFAEVFQTPGVASLYVSLDHLERDGFIESRWSEEPPEALAERGGHRRREYNLTPRGTQRLSAS